MPINKTKQTRQSPVAVPMFKISAKLPSMDILFLGTSNQTITNHVNSTRSRTVGLVSRIGVYSLVIGVHVCGIVLLGCLWKASRARVRHLLLINLSVFVAFVNLLEICSAVHALSGIIGSWNSYRVVNVMMLPLIQFPTLFFINTDRLLEVNKGQVCK